MNEVLRFVLQNWPRLPVSLGPADRMTCLTLTPRFETARHIIFLFFQEGDEFPTLVGKVPRTPGDDAALVSEHENLSAIHAATRGQMPSIPRAVALERFGANSLFLQTGLPGKMMASETVRARTHWCLGAGSAWITALHSATVQPPNAGAVFENEVEYPIEIFRRLFPLTSVQDHTMRLCESALAAGRDRLPSVFEHGDFSHPNIFLLSDDSVGAVDWELARPVGVPAADLFFFLSYVSAAISKAHTVAQYLAAFHDAFFGSEPWARPYIERYAAVMQIAPDLMLPLFILCWTRYVVNRALRSAAAAGLGLPDMRTMDWVREDRYYAFWRHTVDQLDQLAWMTAPEFRSQATCNTVMSVRS